MTTHAERVANSKAKQAKNDWGLKVSPEEAAKAILLLKAYVDERKALAESKKIVTPPHAIQFMAAMRDFCEEVGKLVKAPAEAVYNTIRFTLVPTIFDENGVEKETISGIGTCRLQDDITVKTVDTNALHNWLTEQGQEDIIKETVNAQTLAAFLRGRIKENAAIVKAAMKDGATDPEVLQALQKPLPGPEIATITPIVRATIVGE